jgi:hypothetical protein
VISDDSLSSLCFLADGPKRGILRIYNQQTDRSLLVESNDVVKDMGRIRFSLDMGLYTNACLQEEYARIGLELFAIEPVALAEDKEDLAKLLVLQKARFKAEGIALYEEA